MGKHGPSVTLRYNGEIFRRYPDSDDANLVAYWRSQNGRFLHRAIWEHERGPIPPGHHIHHVDGNPLNNAIENLECLASADHLSHHGHDLDDGQIKARVERMHAIRHLTKEWHASPEGRAWHAEHGRRVYANKPHTQLKCEQCGAEYETKWPNASRFCSNACKSRHRRASGVDDITRPCEHCGEGFRINRYSRRRFCDRHRSVSQRRSRAA